MPVNPLEINAQLIMLKGWSGGGFGQGDHDVEAVWEFSKCLQRIQRKTAFVLWRRKKAENLGISG